MYSSRKIYKDREVAMDSAIEKFTYMVLYALYMVIWDKSICKLPPWRRGR